MPRLRLALLAATVALVASACRLEVQTGVTLEGDGSGRVVVAVTLDAEAARRVPDLADLLAVDDLVEAGWTITGPTKGDDGRTYVRATRAFTTPDEAARLLNGLAGAGGPFRDFEVERRASLLQTSFDLRGVVDLTRGVDGFSDDALRQLLDGTSLGLRVDELERLAGAGIGDVATFRVTADLPGEVSSDATERVGDAVAWAPELGGRLDLAATSRAWNVGRLAWGLAAAVAGVALVVVLVRGASGPARLPTGAGPDAP